MKAWTWLKTHWKWLLLPFWVVSLALVWILSGGRRTLFPLSTPDAAVDKAMEARDAAVATFRARLDEMAEKAEERMRNASEEQIEEYKRLKDKPIEEVAKWIDSLS